MQLSSFSKKTFSFWANKANGVWRGVDGLKRLPAKWFIFYIYPSVSSFSHSTHTVKAERTWLGPAAIYSGHFSPRTVKHLCCFLQSLLSICIYFSLGCTRQLFIKKDPLWRTCRKTTDWWAPQNHWTTSKPRNSFWSCCAPKSTFSFFFFFSFLQKRRLQCLARSRTPNEDEYYSRTVWCISELRASFSECVRISFWKVELV